MTQFVPQCDASVSFMQSPLHLWYPLLQETSQLPLAAQVWVPLPCGGNWHTVQPLQ